MSGINGSDVKPRLEPDSGGPISFGVGVTLEGLVFMEFDQPVKFIGLSPDEAEQTAIKLAQLSKFSKEGGHLKQQGDNLGVNASMTVDDSKIDVIRADGTIEKGTGEIIPPPKPDSVI